MVKRPILALVVLVASGLSAGRAADEEKNITNSIGMKLVLIPAGKFQMGSPETEEGRESKELQHEVTITRPFYLGVYEVTQREWETVVQKKANTSKFNSNRGGSLDHPAENMNWRQAVDYCKKLSALPAEKEAGRTYRLPTEAEWEYACRAGTTTPVHYGKSLSSKEANFNGNFPYGGAEKGDYLRKTEKVGSHAPNAWGLYDMHGNVAEWCSDYYDPKYYSTGPKEDPKGPAKGVFPTDYENDFYRVVRGGCWVDEAVACRSAYRFRAMPHDAYQLIGLRLVCEVSGKSK
jgi:formylglycine-generating enzyme required for sulfatase activity